MPDITIKAGRVLDLDLALNGGIVLGGAALGVLQLSPPPTPKGRYALSKVATPIVGHAEKYRENHTALLEKHARKDKDGKPVKDAIPGGFKYDLTDQAAFNAEKKEMDEEPIVLSGVRQITHAELGVCPITGAHERVLIELGLLEDKEPIE